MWETLQSCVFTVFVAIIIVLLITSFSLYPVLILKILSCSLPTFCFLLLLLSLLSECLPLAFHRQPCWIIFTCFPSTCHPCVYICTCIPVLSFASLHFDVELLFRFTLLNFLFLQCPAQANFCYLLICLPPYPTFDSALN